MNYLVTWWRSVCPAICSSLATRMLCYISLNAAPPPPAMKCGTLVVFSQHGWACWALGSDVMSRKKWSQPVGSGFRSRRQRSWEDCADGFSWAEIGTVRETPFAESYTQGDWTVVGAQDRSVYAEEAVSQDISACGGGTTFQSIHDAGDVFQKQPPPLPVGCCVSRPWCHRGAAAELGLHFVNSVRISLLAWCGFC